MGGSDRVPRADVSRGSGFGAVWAVPDGWEASLGYASGEASEVREVWRSSDGIAWEHQADIVLADAPPVVAVGVDGRRLMVADVYSTSTTLTIGTWTSDDGVAWAAEPFPDDLAAVDGGIGPTEASEPWLLVGTTSKGGSGAGIPAVWSSSDLRAWEQLELTLGRRERSLAGCHDPYQAGLRRRRR